MKSKSCSRKSRGERGFSLVVVLSLMILLTVIAIGLLNLSSIQLRSTQQGQDMALARSNARMALMLALGELQKTAGPDQRVTATSEILDDDSGKLANPHWTGVWRTDGLKAEPMPAAGPEQLLIYRDSNSSSAAPSLKDRRYTGGKYDRKAEVLNWLVSQRNRESLIDPAIALADDGKLTVELVSKGSAEDPGVGNRNYQVKADLVPVAEGGEVKGGYAWAVLDDGVKAMYNLGNPTMGPAKDAPWRSAARPSMGMAKAGVADQKVFQKHEQVGSEEMRKVTDWGGVSLMESQAPGLGKYFHAATVASQSVLADTMRGGLRRDLTAYLETGTMPALGSDKTREAVTAESPILNEKGLELVSPKWGLVKSWYDQAMVAGTSGAVNMSRPVAAARRIGIRNGANWDQAGPGPAIESSSTMAFHPIVVDASISYGASLSEKQPVTPPDANGRKAYRANFHMTPRVVLYNPYDVKIQNATYCVQLSAPSEVVLARYLGTTQQARWRINSAGQMNSIDWNVQQYNRPSSPAFLIPDVTLEPGECVLYTLNSSKASTPVTNRSVLWENAKTPANRSIGLFQLSPNNPPPLVDSIYFPIWRSVASIPNPDIMLNSGELQNTTYQIFLEKDGYANANNPGWYHTRFALYAVKGSTGDGSYKAMEQGLPGYDILQYFNQTENGSVGSVGPYVTTPPPTTSEPMMLLNSSNVRYPFHRMKYGMRLQWMSETDMNQTLREGNYNSPFLDYALLANQNLLASWQVKGPVENVYRATSVGARYFNGPFIDDFYGWDWDDPRLAPVLVNGKNRVSPYGMPGVSNGAVYPIMGVPKQREDLVSMAMLQHVPMSMFTWHPTYAVGNGLADPRTPRNATTLYINPSDWNAIGYAAPAQDTFRQGHAEGNPALNNQAFIYDLSYEMNYALWDRYFLSTVPQVSSSTSSQWQLGDPLANPRLVTRVGGTTADTLEAKNANLAAKHLLIAGGFNVNSTSVAAWAAVLGSMKSNPTMKIELGDGTKEEADHVFSHLIRPVGGKFTPSSTVDPCDKDMWTGYRALTEEQVYELAGEMVKEVKTRGPFLSLADFINRRLVSSPARAGAETEVTKMGLKGAMQAAIDRTSINREMNSNSYKIEKVEYEMGGADALKQVRYGSTYPKLSFPLMNGTPKFGLKPDHNHYAESKLVNTPTYVTQADVLQKIGQTLSARSDTFTIRAYGETKDKNGKVTARAWCEAKVQRTVVPYEADVNGVDPDVTNAAKPMSRMGRKFEIIDFRWLTANEV